MLLEIDTQDLLVASVAAEESFGNTHSSADE